MNSSKLSHKAVESVERDLPQRSVEKRSQRQLSPPVSLSDVSFNPHAEELVTTWSSNASAIFCVNTYPNGITYSAHSNSATSVKRDADDDSVEQAQPNSYLPNQFHLRFRDTKDYLLPTGKYFIYKENGAQALERRLAQLHEQGILKSSVIYFGTITDPFFSFQKKFNLTMACLELFEQYRPGLLVVQTRSPMVISALPVLRSLGKNAVVCMPIESMIEGVIHRYTPGQPKIRDRLIAADGLRAQGVTVNATVSPILPYGDFYRDAWDFAALVDKHADYVTFGCLACGKPGDEAQLKGMSVSQRLVSEKQYRLLRPHAYRNVYYALQVLAPEKLLLPSRVKNDPAQLSLFAA